MYAHEFYLDSRIAHYSDQSHCSCTILDLLQCALSNESAEWVGKEMWWTNKGHISKHTHAHTIKKKRHKVIDLAVFQSTYYDHSSVGWSQVTIKI